MITALRPGGALGVPPRADTSRCVGRPREISILQGELRTGRRGMARTEKGSSQEHLPLSRQGPALPKSSGPAAQVLPSKQGLGFQWAGARLRVRVSPRPPGGSSGQWAAEKAPRRRRPRQQRTLAAPAPDPRTPRG